MTSTASASSDDQTRCRLEAVLVQQVGGAHEDEGRRILVDGPLLVGRDNPLFAERYPKLSRRHAEIVPERGRLRVVDLGSRHGTFVRGRRLERGVVAAGDLIDVGGVGFVVTHAPRVFVPEPHPRFAYESYGFANVLTTIAAARRSRQPVVIVGEPGAGKSALAEELVAGVGPSDAPASVRTWDLSAPRSERALDGVLVVDRLDEADEQAQRDLLAALRAADATPDAPRLVVLTCVSPEELVQRGKLRPAIGAYLESWVVHVPPLRDRPEDILPIARARLSSFAPDDRWEIQPKLLARLLADRWTGNVRALLAEIERLYLSATDNVLVDVALEQAPVTWRAGGVRRVAADGSWVEAPDGKRELLGGRRVLRSVLTALVEAHLRGAEGIGAREIARLAWPGERVLPRAAANRVYVAVTTLRKLGFGPTIENTDDGYRFAKGAVEIVSV